MSELALDIAGFIGRMEVAQHMVARRTEAALERATRIVEAEAKAVIGHDETAEAPPFFEWAPLAESTIAEKERLGYTGQVSEYDSLLRTGAMRDSIGHQIKMDGMAGEAVIGSDSDIAVDQELGTQRIPPRSFLGGSLVRRSEDVVHLLGEHVVAALFGEEVQGGKLPLLPEP